MAASSEGVESNPLREHLPRSTAVEPCAIVLFGSTGDLTHRKLAPALFELAGAGDLPSDFAVVGFGRRPWGDDQYRESLRETLAKKAEGPAFEEAWGRFAPHVVFVEGNLDDPAAFDRLRERLEEVDRSHATRGNRLFYLAVGPEFFAPIVAQLGQAGLIYTPDNGDGPWSRVVVEKPFGQDLDSAHRLNHELKRVLDEGQIYRIDHYLGKETVQNILALRFGNAIFEPIWNRRYVDHVQITVSEELGVGTRGGYYDTSGALLDIVQNHMLQVLSIVAMEPPARFESRDVRDEKVKVLRAIAPFDAVSVARDAVRGQYAAGWIAGDRVPGYRDEKGVDPESNTDTFVAMRVSIDNWRWSGTPFYLRTGKRLPRRATEVAIQFKQAPHLPFATSAVESGAPNLLILRIQPDEGASLRFLAKVPGPQIDLRVVSMDFTYGNAFLRSSPEAYERLLLDALLGDSTLFARWDEVERAWEIMQGLIDEWSARPGPYPNYEAGSWGPAEADELMSRDDREWRRP
jgi:glucose-6-phosphate 1-dehydrogenase